jgi:hypothetical protein
MSLVWDLVPRILLLSDTRREPVMSMYLRETR